LSNVYRKKKKKKKKKKKDIISSLTTARLFYSAALPEVKLTENLNLVSFHIRP